MSKLAGPFLALLILPELYLYPKYLLSPNISSAAALTQIVTLLNIVILLYISTSAFTAKRLSNYFAGLAQRDMKLIIARSKSIHRICEVLGLALILVSALVSFGITDPASKFQNDQKLYAISLKLDYLLQIQRDPHAANHLVETARKSFSAGSGPQAIDPVISNMRWMLLFIGTIIVLLSKLIEAAFLEVAALDEFGRSALSKTDPS